MTDLFREVDEDVRRDRAIEIWSRYQYWFLALGILIVAGTVAWRVNLHFREEAAQAAGAQYEAAVELSRAGKGAEAEAAFAALARSAPKGYAGLARLRGADELAKRDPAAAIAAFDAIDADKSEDVGFRDLAQLRAAVLRADRDDPKELMLKLSPLAAASFPYHNSIRELLGLAELQRNEFEAAGRWFDAVLTDPLTPTALRQRVEAFLALVQGGKKPASPAAAPQPSPAAPAPANASPKADASPKSPAKAPE